MEISRALEILQALADGFSPFNGEVFEHENIFQNPDTVRALYLALDALKSKQNRIEKRKNLPANTGKTWTEEENTLLIEEFENGMNIFEIARNHERTMGGIRARLIQIGKIQY